MGLSSYAYNLLQVTRLHGVLHTAALSQGLQEMTRRHAVLRTTFTHVAGQLLQLPVVDLQGLPEREQAAQVCTLACAEAQRPFDLAQGPLLRATLVRLAAAEHVLILTMHHIVTDGWSHGVFWRELGALYAALVTGQPALLPEPALQYADFAHWQLQWLQSDLLATQLAYWKQQLAGVPT